ncbi:MAG: class I SAM-dependent methyltransferase [Calothrix sp. MO_167.B12]|nr:class I SAM-dependent methyltransferase [Calothrix sp. MO_167.B12]
MKALDEDLNPVQRNRPTHDGAPDPLVGRGNSRATTFVPNQLTQLLPVARCLFPRPKVGQFPNPTPSIALVDLNPNSLEYTAQRIHRYQPTTLFADIFQPLPLESTFDSIGINYLLHCLPGNNILSKSVVFRNLKALLNDGGVIFGTTILGQGVSHNFFARKLMRTYNAKGIFDNTNDTREDLEIILKEHFRTYDIQIVGCVAFFAGWK